MWETIAWAGRCSHLVLVLESLAVERIDELDVDREANQQLVNEVHGYPVDGVERFASPWSILVLAAVALPILYWGLVPW